MTQYEFILECAQNAKNRGLLAEFEKYVKLSQKLSVNEAESVFWG